MLIHTTLKRHCNPLDYKKETCKNRFKIPFKKIHRQTQTDGHTGILGIIKEILGIIKEILRQLSNYLSGKVNEMWMDNTESDSNT